MDFTYTYMNRMKNKIWNRFEIFTGFEPILIQIKSKNYKKYQKNAT